MCTIHVGKRQEPILLLHLGRHEASWKPEIGTWSSRKALTKDITHFHIRSPTCPKIRLTSCFLPLISTAAVQCQGPIRCPQTIELRIFPDECREFGNALFSCYDAHRRSSHGLPREGSGVHPLPGLRRVLLGRPRVGKPSSLQTIHHGYNGYWQLHHRRSHR